MLNKKQKIISCMTGTDGNLSILGTFQIIQDAITELMGALKIDGITAKEQYNAIWVYTKTRAKFYKKALWNQEIDVSCYISLISLAKMNIDVVAKDDFGNIVFIAKTELCALDITTQRIRKISTVGVNESMLTHLEPINLEFAKFDNLEMPILENVQVKSTNIDMSYHTNNIEYLRFILNTYTVAELEEKPISEIEIIFSNQSFENDILTIKKGKFTNKDLLTIDKADKTVIKCEIVY